MKAKGWGRIITVTTSFFTMIRQQMHPYVGDVSSACYPTQHSPVGTAAAGPGQSGA